MTEENHEKPQSGWSEPGFEPGNSRMRVSCVTTEPPRSVSLMLLGFKYAINAKKNYIKTVGAIFEKLEIFKFFL